MMTRIRRYWYRNMSAGRRYTPFRTRRENDVARTGLKAERTVAGRRRETPLDSTRPQQLSRQSALPTSPTTGISLDRSIDVLAVQQAFGNRAVQRLLSPTDPRLLQREGWTGKDIAKGSANVGKKQVGKIWRIPIEGLNVGNLRDDLEDAYAWEIDPVTKKADKSKPTHYVKERTRETAIGRALVLIPDYLKTDTPVEVLLHLHGFGIGYRQSKGGGPTRDEAVDLTESQLETSNRNMIAVLPQGGYHSGFAAFNADPYLDAVFAKLPQLKGVTRGQVVVTAHSGGGNTVAAILAEENQRVEEAKKTKKGKQAKQAASRLPSGMGELVMFDGLHGDAHQTLSTWLENQLNRDLAELTNPERAGNIAKQREYLKTSMRFRGYHTKGQGYTYRYEEVDKALTKWFDDHKDALGGTSSQPFLGLRLNYQVIATGLEPSDHEGMMGKARLFESSLKALEALPPVTSTQGQATPAVQPTPALQRDNAKPTFKKQKFTLSSNKVIVVKASEKKGLAELQEAPIDYGAAILKLAGLDDKEWFKNFTMIKFLGRSLNNPIHTSLAEHLTAVEAKFADKYGGTDKDPKIAGDTLGLSDETIKGGRESPTSAALSMHLFGLAVDLNYTANPFISASANPVFDRAGLLVDGTTSQFKANMTYDELSALDTTLTTYFSYIDNATELESRLNAATAKPWQGVKPAQAVKVIQKDLDTVASLWQRSDKSDKAIIRAGGFLDLKKELVEGMDLNWGASYGDIMHFDLRDKGVGAKVYQAIVTYGGQKEQESTKQFAAEKEAAEKAAQAAKAAGAQ
jgi:hypothetical protein